MILKLVEEIRKAFPPFDWSIFLMTYLLAIAAATLLRAVPKDAAIELTTLGLQKAVPIYPGNFSMNNKEISYGNNNNVIILYNTHDV